MTKYLEDKPFSFGYSKEYADNYEKTFGKKKKKCLCTNCGCKNKEWELEEEDQESNDLDEFIKERTKGNSEFPKMVEKTRKKNKRKESKCE